MKKNILKFVKIAISILGVAILGLVVYSVFFYENDIFKGNSALDPSLYKQKPTGIIRLDERINTSNTIYGNGEVDESTGISKQWIENFGVKD